MLSYDAGSAYYADPSKPLGAALDDMLPAELHEMVEIRFPVFAVDLPEHHEERSLSFVFIDANHMHPWPTLDFLAVLPLLADGAEVALHDIDLPNRGTNPQYGAKCLFDGLEVVKHREPEQHNIGSVIVPPDRDALIRQLLTILRGHEWETQPAEHRIEPLLARYEA